MSLWIALDAGNVKRSLVNGRVHLSIVLSSGKMFGVIVFSALMVNYCGKSSELSADRLRYSKSVVRLHYPTIEKMRGKPFAQRILACAHVSGLRPYERAPLRARLSQAMGVVLEYVLQIGSFGSF